jgi:hypothetical protein
LKEVSLKSKVLQVNIFTSVVSKFGVSEVENGQEVNQILMLMKILKKKDQVMKDLTAMKVMIQTQTVLMLLVKEEKEKPRLVLTKT